jgi:Ni/Co efflux regulator RcnB
MKHLKLFLIAAALMTGGSALASAQPMDHDGFRDHDRYQNRDRDDRRFRDRDDRRFERPVRIRNEHFFVGERRFINGYYWTWDGGRWCRRDGRAVFYFNF